MNNELNNSKSFVIRLGFSTFMAYMGCYSGKNLMSAIKPSMIEEGVFEKISIGNMSSAFFYAYAVGQLLNGLLGDKICPKKLISAGLLFAGVISFIFPFAAVTELSGYILWATCGFLCSMLWAPLSKTVAENVPKNKARILMLALTAASIVGQMIAYIIAAICSIVADWKTAFLITGIILVAISILYYILLTVLEKKGLVHYNLSGHKYHKTMPHHKTHKRHFHPINMVLHLFHIRTNKKTNINGEVSTEITTETTVQTEPSTNTDEKPTTPVSLKYLISHAIIPAAICVMANGVIRNAISDWVPTYITEEFGTSTAVANAISILLPIINLLGAFMSLRLLKYFKDNEHKLSAVLYGTTALLFAYMFFFGSINSVLTIAVLFISCALANAVANLYFSVYILRFTNTGKTSGISGSLDCTAYIASAIATSLIGFISVNYSWTTAIGSWIVVAIIGMLSSMWASAKVKGKEF